MQIIVVDPEMSVREMLIETLKREGEPGWLIEEADCGQKAEFLSGRAQACMAIVNPDLPDMPGGELVRRLQGGQNGCRVLVYAGTPDQTCVAALRAGPAGFVHRRESLAMLRCAIHAVAGDADFYSPRGRRLRIDMISRCGRSVARQDGQPCDGCELSARELDVLLCRVKDMTNKETAALLGISERTVENHHAAIKRKTGCVGTASLVLFAVRLGLVAID